MASKNSISSVYESASYLEHYLLFHYGNAEDQMPFPFGPKNSVYFPIRCVTECLDMTSLPPHPVALELGCSVGRSSFELARHCHQVIAIDSSQAFISTARQIQQDGQLDYSITEEGTRRTKRVARVPNGVDPTRVKFQCADAMEFCRKKASYDVVLAANLICRLKDPLTFLTLLKNVVVPHGQLIVISPYSWLEEFTPKSQWINREDESNDHSGLESLKHALNDGFIFKRAFDLPFLIREHLRKYEWGVSQASIWQKR